MCAWRGRPRWRGWPREPTRQAIACTSDEGNRHATPHAPEKATTPRARFTGEGGPSEGMCTFPLGMCAVAELIIGPSDTFPQVGGLSRKTSTLQQRTYPQSERHADRVASPRPHGRDGTPCAGNPAPAPATDATEPAAAVAAPAQTPATRASRLKQLAPAPPELLSESSAKRTLA